MFYALRILNNRASGGTVSSVHLSLVSDPFVLR